MCISIPELMRLIIMKMNMKTKNRPQRYYTNRPTSTRRDKYSKCKKCLSKMIFYALSNT